MEIFSGNYLFWLLLLGCIICLCLTYWDRIHQRIRFIFALAAQAVPTALAYVVPSSDLLPNWLPVGDSPVGLWICVTALQFLLAIGLTHSHFGHIKHTRNDYFQSFDQKTSELNDGGAEGESTVSLLLYLIYGVIAMLGATLSYFVIGQRFNLTGENVAFVFRNNEGFTAALSLLIIILTSAAIPIYTDLGKQINAASTAFEHDVSLLAQHADFLKYNSDAIWRHFASVSYSVAKEWKATIDEISKEAKGREGLSTAFYHHIFLPYEVHRWQSLYEATVGPLPSYFRKTRRELQPQTNKVKDRLRRGFVLDELFVGQSPEDKRQENDELFSELLKPSEGAHSRGRINNWLSDWKLDHITESSKFSEEKQIQHSRRLEFLGWTLQRPPIALRRQWRSRTNDFRQISWLNNELVIAPSNILKAVETSIVPSTEFFLFSILDELRYENKPQDQTDFIRKAIDDFRARIGRHLNDFAQTTESLPSANRQIQIANVSDRLEIDASALYDDMLLFQQLEWAYPRDNDYVDVPKRDDAKDDAKLAAKVRFLHYALWFIDASDRSTSLGRLLDNTEQQDGPSPSSHSTIIKWFQDLYDRIENDVKNNRDDVGQTGRESEFLFLLLADHRSALYNWLRAARANDCRKRLANYAKELEALKQNHPRQLGLTILPTRAARQNHLRWYIHAPRVGRSPMRLQSIYDVRPDIVHARSLRSISMPFLIWDLYVTYKQIIVRLVLSKNFIGKTTFPDNEVLRFILENGLPETIPDISPQTRSFCNFINNFVFEEKKEQIPPLITDFPESHIKPVFTTFFHLNPRSEIFIGPSKNSENESALEDDLVWHDIYNYCVDRKNQDVVENHLISSITAESSSLDDIKIEYEAWLKRLTDENKPA